MSPRGSRTVTVQGLSLPASCLFTENRVEQSFFGSVGVQIVKTVARPNTRWGLFASAASVCPSPLRLAAETTSLHSSCWCPVACQWLLAVILGEIPDPWTWLEDTRPIAMGWLQACPSSALDGGSSVSPLKNELSETRPWPS